MKKFGLAVAMVLGMAGVAQAQATMAPQNVTINATAKIDQTLILTATDSTFDCGTVTYLSTNCGADGDRKATVKVEANSAWTLTMADASGANKVRFTNSSTPARAGSFDVVLNWTETEANATCSGTTCTGIPTPAGGVLINIVDPANSIVPGTTGSVSSLAVDDQWGPYTGSFIVTLTGT